jgi:hypothetical protein
MVRAKVGDTATTPFIVENTAGSLVSGLAIGVFTIVLSYNGGVDPDGLTFTLTEPYTDGRYVIAFTPARVGTYEIWIDTPGPPTGSSARFGQQFESETNDLDDLKSDLITIITHLTDIKGAGWTIETLEAIYDLLATAGVWTEAEKDQALQDLTLLKADIGDASAESTTILIEAKHDGAPRITPL